MLLATNFGATGNNPMHQTFAHDVSRGR